MVRLDSPETASRWLAERVGGTLRTDSRAVRPGDAFIAWPGHAVDGRRFVEDALKAGASACLVEAEGAEAFGFTDERIASLAQLKAATGHIAHAFFERPSRSLRVVAATGTNGKTSTAWWTAQALTRLGSRCGVIGTLGIGEPSTAADGEPHVEPTGLTTPDPVALHAAFRRFVDGGYAACAIEASSIGLAEHRLAGANIEVALFTNFTRDHLDYHGDMDAYWEAKSRLFDWPTLAAAVINVDDEKGPLLAETLRARGEADVWTYSVHASGIGARNHLVAHGLEYLESGLAFTLAEGDRRIPVQTSLIGHYNASNLLAVIGGLRALGVPLDDAVAASSKVTPVPGRMQRVTLTPRPQSTASDPPEGSSPAWSGPALGLGTMAGGPEVVVDYAHSPDALDKALAALRPLAQARGGKLWCVFGCGGNRDATKRPMMGAIAERSADRVVVTSDNPRNEAPCFILSQILAGIRGHEDAAVIDDRRQAIAYAVGQADPRDVVLIAGKGHEDYQEIAGVRHPFSDVAEARIALQGRTSP